MVVAWGEEDLRLMLEPSERGTVDYCRRIPIVWGAHIICGAAFGTFEQYIV